MKKLICLGVISLFIVGCATLFKGTREEVNFASDPTGAQVYVNGNLIGSTPVSLKLESKGDYTVEFKKDGYPTKTVKLTNHVGAGWIVLDVLGGLFPVIIDAATGAWYALDQKNVNAVLERQQPLEKM